MPFCCYNLLKYYSLILGVPGAVIIPKLQSCIPIVVSGCCLLASSRSGGAHSSHSRPSKSKGPPSMQFWWLLSSPAPRSCAISAIWCWRWSPRSSLPFASLTLFVLPLVVIVVLFLTVENHCCVFSFCVSLCATGVTCIQSCLTESEQQHCWPSAWFGGGASTELRFHLPAAVVWLYALIHVGERGWQPCWDQNSKDCNAPTAVYRHRQLWWHAAMEQMDFFFEFSNLV